MDTSVIEQHIVNDYWIKKLNSFTPVGRLTTSDRVIYTCKSILEINNDKLNRQIDNNQLATVVLLSSFLHILLKKYFPWYNGLLCTPDVIVDDTCYQDKLLFYSFQSKSIETVKQVVQCVKKEFEEVLQYRNYNTSLLENHLHNENMQHFCAFGISYDSFHIESKKFDNIRFKLYIQSEGSKKLNFTIFSDETFIESFVAEEFLKSFEESITNFYDYLDTPCNLVNYLSYGQRNAVLNEYNHNDIRTPIFATAIGLFEQQVDRTPYALALSYGTIKYTYQQLNEAANALAHYLINKCLLQPEEVVGLYIPKTDQAVIAILAVLKAGAAYLPLALDYPEDRIQYVIEDSCIRLCLSLSHVSIPPKATIKVNKIDLDKIALSDNKSKSGIVVLPSHLAYLIYTSGSTGRPKGVMIEHHSLVNMAIDQIRIFSIVPNDVILLFASLSFDASVSEIFTALFSGAALAVPVGTEAKDKAGLLALIHSAAVRVITLPPSYLDLFSEEEIKKSGLRCLISAGEPAHVSKAVECSKYVQYVNAYGPTECTVCVSAYQVSENDAGKKSIPIGRPLANVSVYILDNQMKPLPVGVAGTIYVSGIGLARGYWNQPELTQQRFLPNPFNKSGRLYDTGDLGRWLPGGDIEFIERIDAQVKIRGYRIEPGEIEQVILQQTDLAEQVYIDVREVKAEKAIVAYIVPRGDFKRNRVVQRISKFLPNYMLPLYYVTLTRLPLTVHGKVDRGALPDVGEPNAPSNDLVFPVNDLEKQMTKIWQRVLELQQVGVLDNFFELGGHSLKVAKMIAEVNRTMGYALKYKTVYDYPVIRSLAAKLKQSHSFYQEQPIPLAAKTARYPLTPGQKRIWLAHQLNDGAEAYNISGAFTIRGPLDIPALERAFRMVIQRHESLRTVFITVNGVPMQQVRQAWEETFHFEITTMHKFDWRSLLLKESQAAFDLANDLLIRCRLVRVNENDHLFLLTIHHLITDGWSMGVLFRDLFAAYRSLKECQPVNWEPLPFQYKDYVAWYLNRLETDAMQVTARFWQQYIGVGLPPLHLPYDIEPVRAGAKGAVLHYSHDGARYAQLVNLAQIQQTTLFAVLLSCFGSLLWQVTNQREIVLGIPLTARTHPDLHNQIGYYLNIVPLRFRCNPHHSLAELIKNTDTELIKLYDNQSYPVLDLLDNGRTTTPAFNVVVNYIPRQELFDIDTGDLQISTLPYYSETNKFNISIAFYEGNMGELCTHINYNATLLAEETVKQWGSMLHQMLNVAPALFDKSLLHLMKTLSGHTTSDNQAVNFFI